MAIDEMKRESARILRERGVDLDFKLASELEAMPQFERLVRMRFDGECRMENVPRADAPTGPLGFTHLANGAVLSFSEVHCGKVRDLVRCSILHFDSAADVVLGRALGRVAAHEVYHMLAETRKHGRGIARSALTVKQLTAPDQGFGFD